MKTDLVPTNSHSIIRGHKQDSKMINQRWRNPRLYYIKSIQAHTPTTCPECDTELEVDEEQIYCPRCGLITQDSYDYQAGIKYTLPHGLKLM